MKKFSKKFLHKTLTIALFLLLPFFLYGFSSNNIKVLLNREYTPYVKNLLKNAKSSIYVVMYEMRYYNQYPLSPSNQLIHELIRAKKRGVNVNVLLDISSFNEKNTERNQEVGEMLKKNGINVKYDSLAITTHSKLVVIDKRFCVVGSHNWSYHALTDNNEISVIIDSKDLAEKIIGWINSL